MMVADDIPGYDYGSPNATKSPISTQEFELLKQSAGFAPEDECWLQVARESLLRQTEALVSKWRELTAAPPHLATCSERLDGQKDAR
jgi:hypothetical protein